MNEKKENLILIGLGSSAKTIYRFVTKYNLFNVIGFAADRKYITDSKFCDCSVYAIEDLESIMDKTKDKIFVAIQWNKLNADRKSLYLKLKSQGYKFANLISPMAVINGEVVGDNCWITDKVIVDFGAIIEENVFIKIGAFVGPNSIVHSHCFIGMNSLIAGGCEIGEQTFVGITSVVFDQVTVGRKCLIGGATIVKRNLADFSKISSTSDFVVKQYDEETIESKLLFKNNVR